MPARPPPAPGQESVWDYPRPPRLEPAARPIRVVFNDETIAATSAALRLLETSHPPTYYIPPDDVQTDYLTQTRKSTHCEWKGRAVYFTVQIGERRAEHAAWCYPDPNEPYADMAGYFAFYASLMDACYVDDEKARPQEGEFYGGWITRHVVGPFKGSPGTLGW